MATVVSTAVAFGGVAAVAPSAKADINVTQEYTALQQDHRQAAVQYNKTRTVNRNMDLLQTNFGPGWCIDAALPEPKSNTQYEVRKLDGTSGLYGFNLTTGGDYSINPDIQRAAINLTKLMLDDYYANRAEDVKKKALAMQALLSNNQQILDQMRGYIKGEVKPTPGFYGFGWASRPPALSAAEFQRWTGFEIRGGYGTMTGQSKYYLAKNESSFSQLKVNPGEYVTVLVPTNYNIYQDVLREPTNQRIVIIAQPGLDNYNPKVVKETVTTTVTAPRVTKTVTVPGETITQTVTTRPGASTVTATTRSTVTTTETYQPVEERTVTETQPNVTITETKRPDVVTATEKTTLPRETETTTVTGAPQTVTVEKREPVVVTETVTEQATTNVDGATETATVTQAAQPVTETVRVTEAPRTETRTVTAAPETKVVETTVTSTNRQVVERTSVVERYTRKYTYALAFSGNDKSQTIDVDKLGDWKIDFIDDSNGLVKVEKVLVDGKYVLKITPVKEGRGTVRIVVVDTEGNRHEYSINVVNEKTDQVTVNDVTVNNHFFNVGVANIEQTITVPEGWDYKVEGPATLEQVAGSTTQYRLKLTEGLNKGEVKVKVFEKVNGKATGNENNYIFNIDTVSDRATQTRVIGNYNSYKLEIAGVEQQPEIVSGNDLIEKIEKRGDFWVITPKQGATGDAVIEAVDKNGKVYTYTLKIQPGTNVLVDNETRQINAGDSVEIRGGQGFTKKIVSQSGEWEWDPSNPWKVTNKTDGTLVVNVYAEDGKVLVGTYTIVAKPVDANFETLKVTQNVIDRNTVKITRGSKVNELKVKDGEGLFTYTSDANGNWTVLPVPGAEGTIVISEVFNGTELVEYTINVTPGEVPEETRNVDSKSEVTIPGKIRVVEGEDFLVNGAPTNGQFKFVEGANGRVVVETLNSRDLPTKRWIFNVAPTQVREQRFELTPKSESSITLNSSDFTYTVTGKDVLNVTRSGDTLNITPKDGKTGEATVEIKNENGTVVERYIYTVVPGKGGANTATSADYKLSVDGKFTITRLNDNPLQIISGGEWVNLTQDKNQWVLQPKGPDSVGKTVTVVETRGDIVVKRYNIEILPQGTPLNFEEIRTILYTNVKDEIVRGSRDTYTVLRGNDLITVTEPTPGKLQISAQPGKAGQATIEIRDPEGNPVRVVEITVPDTAEGVIPEPKPSIMKNPNKPGTYLVDVNGGSNNVEINICTGNGSCSLVPATNITDEGGKLGVDPGNLPGDRIVVVPVKNGIRSENVNDYIEIEIDRGADTQNGSSEIDGRCIASLVGLSAPLLFLIPVALLSQVQIPGLEGVSAQINNAIREANDYVQRGLGIYDRDRAERAAGVQGAFQIANPEMIGLAAGSLGVITAGLLLIDTVLRNCGQEEASSSYQLGKATNSEFLINGSSGKNSGSQSKDTKDSGSSSSKNTDTAAAGK